jgi:hypothetical protein
MQGDPMGADEAGPTLQPEEGQDTISASSIAAGWDEAALREVLGNNNGI